MGLFWEHSMNLEGRWENKICSILDLKVKGDLFEGTYTYDKNAFDQPGFSGSYRVKGVTNFDPVKNTRTFAGAISWKPIDKDGDFSYQYCVSGFAGQLQIIDGEEVMTSTYLVIHNTKPEYNWESTTISHVTYKRV